jgi:hypothetical protein
MPFGLVRLVACGLEDSVCSSALSVDGQASAVPRVVVEAIKDMRNMRHALGVLGVLAAGVLLAVSCAMNWRFGFSLGRTEFDGQIYGAASAAATA